MDANSPKLTWAYDGNGRQTAEWNRYSFSVKFDMQDSSGCYWHLSMWQTDQERLTRTVILRTSDLSECHSKARRWPGTGSVHGPVFRDGRRHSLKRHFTTDFLSELRDRLGSGLVSIIGDTVTLKRAGNLYEACCPFHNEKTPSFKVLDGQSGMAFLLFWVRRSGRCLLWLQRQGGLEFHERSLTSWTGSGWSYRPSLASSKNATTGGSACTPSCPRRAASLPAISRRKGGAQCVDDLTGRGIGVDQGRALPAWLCAQGPTLWRKMIDHLTDRGFSPEEMVASGAYRRDDETGRLRPFFIKLMIPIRDIQGRPVAFAGRKMGDGEGPKYINSPDCELFSAGISLTTRTGRRSRRRRRSGRSAWSRATSERDSDGEGRSDSWPPAWVPRPRS